MQVRKLALNKSKLQYTIADPRIIPSVKFCASQKPIDSPSSLSLLRAQYHRHHVCIVPIDNSGFVQNGRKIKVALFWNTHLKIC